MNFRKRTLFSVIMLIICAMGYAQNNNKDKEELKINLFSNIQSETFILYIINDEYYLGDTAKANIIIPLITPLEIKSIQMFDKNRKEKNEYAKKTGKYAAKIDCVFIINTKKIFNPDIVNKAKR